MDHVDVHSQHYVVNMHHKRLVHAIKICEFFCSQVMVTFATHLDLLHFSMCTSDSDGFFQSQLVVNGITIKGIICILYELIFHNTV